MTSSQSRTRYGLGLAANSAAKSGGTRGFRSFIEHFPLRFARMIGCRSKFHEREPTAPDTARKSPDSIRPEGFGLGEALPALSCLLPGARNPPLMPTLHES